MSKRLDAIEARLDQIERVVTGILIELRQENQQEGPVIVSVADTEEGLEWPPKV